jgi:hypothetical protein
VALPDGWLADRTTCALGADAESDAGGG